jgi:lipoate-protein ligase A
VTEAWYFIRSGLGQPAANMALDEALLERASIVGRPVLRFYGWREPAATFGYFQRFKEVAAWTHLRPLIRRPTGGGLVPHDRDWTYSLVFPPTHFWHRLPAVESYRRVHEGVHQAFASLGIKTELAPSPLRLTPGQCFAGAERFDVVRDGAKIAGAAQRRNRQGLLIQGSVQPGTFSALRGDWEKALLETGFSSELIAWELLEPDPDLASRTEALAADKFSQVSYNERR